MSKSQVSFLITFGVLASFFSTANGQEIPIVGTVYPDAVATSVVQPSSFVGAAAPVAIGQSGCSSCGGQTAGYVPAPQVHSPTTKSCSGCCLPGPTQAPGYPQLPISSCCGNTGRLNIPPLTTPLRYDTPPVGKAVGRPIFGRWTGY